MNAQTSSGHLDVLLGAAAQDLVEIRAVDELHRDVVGLADAAEIERLRDVAVRQLDGDLRLVDEHLDELLVLREVRMDHLERDVLLEPGDAGGLREMDLGHAADCDLADQPVRAELALSHAPAPCVSLVAFDRLDERRRRFIRRSRAVGPLRRSSRLPGMDEHADQAERRLRPAIERADDLGRDAVGDVDHVGRRGVGDEIEARGPAPYVLRSIWFGWVMHFSMYARIVFFARRPNLSRTATANVVSVAA
jgi:hypothetical protein